MKKFLFAIVILFISSVSRAQLYFKNNLREPVVVAYALQANSKDFNGWFTDGWYTVAPNEKVKLSSGLGLNEYAYYYAKGTVSGKEYTGGQMFLVDPINRFSIRNANMEYVLSTNPGYKWLAFRQIKMNAAFKASYTIQLDF